MLNALHRHWPEYLIEGAGLDLFMIAAGVFATLLEYPGSPVHQALPDPTLRRALMGAAMGSTVIGIIYSPWGKRSGAHINPSLTLTFFRLDTIGGPDAFFYVAAQFVGGLSGILLVSAVLGLAFAHPAVNYVATVPGSAGWAAAYAAEVVISFFLMTMVLWATNTRGLNHYTGLFAGLLVATCIIVEAPLSGMSMNPARTFASAVPAHLWATLWLYFTAPPFGMLLAVEIYLRFRDDGHVYCAKLHHENHQRCIFRCRYRQLRT